MADPPPDQPQTAGPGTAGPEAAGPGAAGPERAGPGAGGPEPAGPGVAGPEAPGDTGGHPADPIEAITAWLDEARRAGEPLPEAMTLATVTPDGWPAARMVMVRGLDRGLVFYTDLESDKGAQLAATPRAAAVLHWRVPAHRQVRAVGPTEAVTPAEADAYWATRPPQARRNATVAHQSRAMTDRAVLEQAVRDLERRDPDGRALPRPPRWSGLRLVPATVELWQEAPDGLHERVRYRRGARPAGDGAGPGGDPGWVVERLEP